MPKIQAYYDSSNKLTSVYLMSNLTTKKNITFFLIDSVNVVLIFDPHGNNFCRLCTCPHLRMLRDFQLSHS